MYCTFFWRAKWITSSVAVLHAWSAVTALMVSGKHAECVDSATDRFKNDISSKPNRFANSSDFFTNSSRVSIP